MWKDYKFHKNAKWAIEEKIFVLNLYFDPAAIKYLKEIGITRGDIKRAVHRDCPWCMRWELAGDGKGL